MVWILMGRCQGRQLVFPRVLSLSVRKKRGLDLSERAISLVLQRDLEVQSPFFPNALMAKTDPVKLEEEKLAHALISRGLLTRAEFEQFQTGADAPPADCSRADLLVRLAKSGLLTDNQARRLGS